MSIRACHVSTGWKNGTCSHCCSVFPYVYSSISQLYLHSCNVLDHILISDSHSAMHYAPLYDYYFVYVTSHMIDLACRTTLI